MIYITGDCHGDYRRLSTEIFPEQKGMTKDDYVIICGDFGFWDESGEQKYWRKWLENKPFTTLWVDGNHENYDLLYTYTVKKWHGGKVQFISPSIIHLMRGQIYEIDGRSFFVFGGARSHDISGGVLEPDDPEFRKKKRNLDRGWEPYRINHVSWWKEEMPCEEEFEEGWRNLERCRWKVDYVITHCCASGIQKKLEGREAEAGRAVTEDRMAEEVTEVVLYETDALTDYLEDVRWKCEFGRWVCGHYHINREVDERTWVLYEQIVRLV